MVANELIEGFGKRIGIELGLDTDYACSLEAVMQLHTTVDDDATWSLFLINRHEVRTQCVILPEKD